MGMAPLSLQILFQSGTPIKPGPVRGRSPRDHPFWPCESLGSWGPRGPGAAPPKQSLRTQYALMYPWVIASVLANYGLEAKDGSRYPHVEHPDQLELDRRCGGLL